MIEALGDNSLAKRAEMIIRSEPCIECGGKAASTVDFDVVGKAEQVASCDDCRPIVEARIISDLRESGVSELNIIGTLGRNGMGRANA